MSNEINNLVSFDNFRVDTEKKVLWCEDKPMKLTLKSVELLCVLIERNGEVVTKEELLDAVWKDSFVEESVLPQNIYRLRKVFKEFADEKDLIETIPSRGYRFSAEIKESVEESVSIERGSIEEILITEEIASETKVLPVNSEHIRNQDPSLKFDKPTETVSQSNLSGRTYGFFTILLLSVFALGATGFWYWSSNDKSLAGSLTKNSLEITRLTESGKAFFPSISRDNQHIAYIRNEENTYSLILRHLPSNSETVVIEPKSHEIRSLTFSADGNSLFYITREKGNLDSTIYQIPIYGGTRRKLVTNVRHYFSLSPDGKSFAFFRYDPKRNETSLMTSNSKGGDEKVVLTRKYPNMFLVWEAYPAWSPNGNKIVVTGFNNSSGEESEGPKFNLIEVDVVTGVEKRIEHPDWGSIFQAAWLKDGDGLIVTARENQNYQFWLLAYPSGEAIRITNDTENYRDFSFSADTNSIYVSTFSYFYDLFTVDLENTEDVKRLTNQISVSYGRGGVDWTKDGESIVYIKSKGLYDGNLWKMNVETQEQEQLTFDKDFEDTNPVVTADGNSVVFASNRSGIKQIWQIDLDGSNLKQLTDLKQGANYPEVSGDGKWLFYNTPSNNPLKLWKKPLDGGEPELILRNSSGHSRVSPSDSSRLLAHVFDPNAKQGPWKYALLSPETKEVSDYFVFSPDNHSFEWSNDGSGIFYPRRALNQNNLWFMSAETKESRQITNFKDLRISNIKISPDGKKVLLSRGSSTSNVLKISNLFR